MEPKAKGPLDKFALTDVPTVQPSVTRAKQDFIDNLLLEMIVEDNEAFSIVERKGFVKFCSGIVPGYELPSRRTVTNKISEEFHARAQKVCLDYNNDLLLVVCTLQDC